jgi:hypothetical protein
MDRAMELVLRAGDLELPIAVGDVLPARVLGPGTIWVAGVRLPAQMPADVEAGEAVRLRVTELDPHGGRVLLQFMREAPPDGGSLIDVRA